MGRRRAHSSRFHYFLLIVHCLTFLVPTTNRSETSHKLSNMLTFEPNRALLNPKFEGYKLDPIDQQNVLSRFPLEHPVTQSSAAGRSPLSFQEVQSRIRHNHLAVGPGANGRAAYVDQESQVVLVNWDDVSVSFCML